MAQDQKWPEPFLFSGPLHTPKEERHGKNQTRYERQIGAVEENDAASQEAR
jgi:hypothetical protein